jgi:hypothetical protein
MCQSAILISVGMVRVEYLGAQMRYEISNPEPTINFVLREGHTEIPCRISFEGLRRQAGVEERSPERAERLLNRYRQEIKRIALARYAAGDFTNGVVAIDVDDIGSPLGRL